SAYPVVAAVRRHVRPRRASVDSAGEAAASAIAADAVLDPQRTFADGRDGLQHVVSLVRRVELGRGGLDATSFTKNRGRLLEADVAKQFLAQVVEQAGAQVRTSHEHCTVAGTLLEAWASLKPFQPKQGKSAP